MIPKMELIRVTVLTSTSNEDLSKLRVSSKRSKIISNFIGKVYKKKNRFV